MIENLTKQGIIDESDGSKEKVLHDILYTEDIDENEEEIACYYLPAGSYLNVKDKQSIVVGDVLIKIPREQSKNKETRICTLGSYFPNNFI